MDGRCETCTYWAEATSWMRVGDFRGCNLLPGSERMPWGMGNDAETMAESFPGIHAYTADASGYASSLMCGPEFGCVHWEATDG